MTTVRSGRPEILEIEGEDRQPGPLGESHHRRVGESEVQVSVSPVDLDGTPKQAGGKEPDDVLASGQG